MNYYNEIDFHIALNCNYYFEQSISAAINDKIKTGNLSKVFSLCHVNIRSLKANLPAFEICLQNMNFKFGSRYFRNLASWLTLGTLMTSAAADVTKHYGRKIGRFKPRRFYEVNMHISAWIFVWIQFLTLFKLYMKDKCWCLVYNEIEHFENRHGWRRLKLVMTSAPRLSRRHHWLEPTSSMPIFKRLCPIIYKTLALIFSVQLKEC